MPQNTHNSSARVQVTNNFSDAVDHISDLSPTESYTFSNVAPGTTAASSMTVTFNIGLTAWRHDHWSRSVTMQAGQEKGQYVSDDGAATMYAGDNGATLTMKVGSVGFNADTSSKRQIPRIRPHNLVRLCRTS